MRKEIIYRKASISVMIIVFVGITLTTLLYLFRQEYKKSDGTSKKYTESVNCFGIDTSAVRESITFILGEDKETDNPYYSEAINYYRFNTENRTEYLITECRSLLEVRDYLVLNPPSNHLPWGLINLVSHGNQWIGLSVPVAPGLKRASVESIEECINQGIFTEVPDTLLDKSSEIFIHGCGIGKNKELLYTVKRAFGGTDELPKVTASELYEYYTSIKYNGCIQHSIRLMANAWPVKYKMGYRPSDTIICQNLEEQYPGTGINWQEAVKRTQPRWTGDPYHYTFEVPVKWVIPYESKDSLPDVSSVEKQFRWLKQQPEITAILNKIDIPAENFNWWFRTVYVDDEKGNRVPAIWVKGYCTILCVLQPVIES